MTIAFQMFLFLAIFLPVTGKRSLWSWQGNDIPQARTTAPLHPSACNNGGWGTEEFAYACPHQAMLTEDMQRAAKFDALDHQFVYALAGGGDDRECGKCYQVRLLDAERVWRNDFPQLVVQIINSGYDVMTGQIDLYVGGGGFGYFTSCNVDCTVRYCQGGRCAKGMFAGNFDSWSHAHYMDPNACYSGGVKWLNETSSASLETMCKMLSANETALKDVMVYDSCVWTNRALFHQNFVSTKYTRVQCPEGLYRLTGIQRQDDDFQKSAASDNVLEQQCQGSRTNGRYCVTTMQDCCVPSCAWGGKVATVQGFDRVDRCFADGSIVS